MSNANDPLGCDGPDLQYGQYGLSPESYYHPDVPRGVVTQHVWSASQIYPGTTRNYWVYVPAQYDSTQPACVMVFQDGEKYVDTSDGGFRVPIVFDHLIHHRHMPVTIGLFVNPAEETEAYRNDPRTGYEKYAESRRAEEYDVVSDRYARFLIEEMLPELARTYRLTQDPEGRAVCGISSGGLCAWTVAWHRPDAFRKVLSHVGSFTDIRGGHVCPYLIRKSEKKPIRVFLQAGTRDMNCVWGDWLQANQAMGSALQFKEYDYRLVIGHGGHDHLHGAAILPASLRWLWRGYNAGASG